MSGCFRDLPPVLDPCCGSRMFYFNDHHPSVLFCDNREDVTETLCDGRMLTIRPDVVSDVTALPFEDEAFPLVVFDPPHLFAGSNGWQAKEVWNAPEGLAGVDDSSILRMLARVGQQRNAHLQMV